MIDDGHEEMQAGTASANEGAELLHDQSLVLLNKYQTECHVLLPICQAMDCVVKDLDILRVVLLS